MGNRKRLKKHKQRAMNRRSIFGKKPMSKETKASRKSIREADKKRTKTDLDKKKGK